MLKLWVTCFMYLKIAHIPKYSREMKYMHILCSMNY